MHSRLLSTFTHTFSWEPEDSKEDIWFISLSRRGKLILITAAALIAQLQSYTHNHMYIHKLKHAIFQPGISLQKEMETDYYVI